MTIAVAIDLGAFTAFGTLIFSVIKYIRKEQEKRVQKYLQLRHDLSAIKERIITLRNLEPIPVGECEIQILDKLSDCQALLGFMKNLTMFYYCRNEINLYVAAFREYDSDMSKCNYQRFLFYAKEYIDAMRNYVL